MTSTCMNCGDPKTLATLGDDYCTACFSAIEGAIAAKTADKPNLTQPEILAAKREALNARAHSAHKGYIDPRSIDRNTIWMNANRPTEG